MIGSHVRITGGKFSFPLPHRTGRVIAEFKPDCGVTGRVDNIYYCVVELDKGEWNEIGDRYQSWMVVHPANLEIIP